MFKLLIAASALISSMSLAIKDTNAEEINAYDNAIKKTRVLSSSEMLFPDKREEVAGQSKTQVQPVFSEWYSLIQKNQHTQK